MKGSFLQEGEFKGLDIHNPARFDLFQYQQILVSCNKIVGFGIYGQSQQIIISLIPAKLNLRCWGKLFANDLHELYQGCHFILRKIFR